MLCALGLLAEWDLYNATHVAIQGLGFFGLIRRTAPFSRLLRHGDVEDLFSPGSLRVPSLLEVYQEDLAKKTKN
jgi:hypothetical protein